MSEPEEGWGSPAESRKDHYFMDSRSLCGRWWFGGTVHLDTEPRPYDCAACRRTLERRKARQP